ncbi:MAG: arginine--tRNA ligase [Planctomycetaceae bacterium]
MNILNTLRLRLAAALAEFTADPQFADMVKPAQDPKFGDFQANCAMPLAKAVGKNPRELAQLIVDRLDVADLCTEPEIAGPGFINLRLRDDWLATQVNTLAADDRLGLTPVDPPKTILVDFSSPNVAKPMHVGHLRSTVIGDALVRILKALGHHVLSDNHIGDWGTQFGMIIYGYKHFRDQAAYDRSPVDELARLYRLVNNLCDYHDAQGELPRAREALQRAEAELTSKEEEAKRGQGDKAKAKELEKNLKKARKDAESARETVASLEKKITSVNNDPTLRPLAVSHPHIVRLSREETAKLHAGDPENRQLWEMFLPQCLGALNRIYQRLDIHFDMTLGESYYDPYLAGVVSELRSKGLCTESDGAQCVFIEGNDAPFLVQKADGAYTYATTDLATIRYRVEELKADEVLYVVDHRQSEHFKLLFATAAKLGFENIALKHVSFGTVMGKDGKPYKTRSGDTVGLEGLLDEAVAKARQIVSENDDRRTDADEQPAPELSDAQRDAIAEVVGLGGIKYADLKHSRDSDYVFDYDKMLAMTGDTATYMQYAYARLCGIFRKGNVDRESIRSIASSPDIAMSGTAATALPTITLSHPAERALALELTRFEEALHAVANDSRPNLLTQYLLGLAGKLTEFYEHCPVLKAEDEATRLSRQRLVDLTGRIIAQGLSLLGIGVCEQM